jgi:hypothetical protein
MKYVEFRVYLIHFFLHDLQVLIENVFLHKLGGLEKLFAYFAPPFSFLFLEYMVSGHRGPFA